jgi:hypothetical protein
MKVDLPPDEAWPEPALPSPPTGLAAWPIAGYLTDLGVTRAQLWALPKTTHGVIVRDDPGPPFPASYEPAPEKGHWPGPQVSPSLRIADCPLRPGISEMPTKCRRRECGSTAHVILFATADQFLGQPANPGQAIYLCLLCGGQTYDAIRAWRNRHRAAVPGWLADDIKADRLPTVLPQQDWSIRRLRPRRPRPGRP